MVTKNGILNNYKRVRMRFLTQAVALAKEDHYYWCFL